MDAVNCLSRQVDLLTAKNALRVEDTRTAVAAIMSGEAPAELVKSWLLALRSKGETAEEIAGAAQALRDAMTPLPFSRPDALDTCGTGGDGSSAFNISTAAALVAAAAGAAVAKHGNRSISSRSGSADVLPILGVKIDAPAEVAARCLDELGICFCFAPHFHPAMKHVAPIRRELGVPTIFNLLGPLANPAGVRRQVLGVGKAHFRPLIAEAMQLLGADRVAVLHGDDGIDEVSLSAPTQVTLVEPDRRSELSWKPEDFGIAPGDRTAFLVDGPEQSAQRILAILEGEKGPCRDVVLLNAAAALWIAGKAFDLAECVRLAAEAIDSGAARDLLQSWAHLSHQ